MKKIIILSIASFLISTPVFALATAQNLSTSDKITAKDFSCIFKSLNGLSENLLKQHNTLYLRYVKKINEINTKLESANKKEANAAYSEYRSLKIDRAFSNNGVVLHELYFENLNSKPTAPSKEFLSKINKDFGSFDNYVSDLESSMKSTRNGWVVSVYNCLSKNIETYIFESHDLHIPVNSKPLLVIDVWEHAYQIDYGIDKDSYIKAIFKNINWEVVSKRYSQSLRP